MTKRSDRYKADVAAPRDGRSDAHDPCWQGVLVLVFEILVERMVSRLGHLCDVIAASLRQIHDRIKGRAPTELHCYASDLFRAARVPTASLRNIRFCEPSRRAKSPLCRPDRL